MRADLERQTMTNQTLKLQVEGKNQLVNSLKAQLGSPYPGQTPLSQTPRSPERSSSDRVQTEVSIGVPKEIPTELSVSLNEIIII